MKLTYIFLFSCFWFGIFLFYDDDDDDFIFLISLHLVEIEPNKINT
jgi:hypothetical protein